jgi:pimeloyl-ACP methyl ester carboxylesterase
MAIAAATATSCTPLRPYRIAKYAGENCTPSMPHDGPTDDRYGAVDRSCDPLIKEVSQTITGKDHGYALHYAEFDDQGRLFPDHDGNGEAPNQTELFLSEVRELTKRDGTEGSARAPVSIVVFVHGWKHGAQSDDANVKWFRAMLAKLSDVESRSQCRREVIGLYAGWRGAGTTLPDIVEDATFWTRKKAAGRVAEGQVRELLTRLRALQDIRNVEWNGKVEDSRRHPSGSLVESQLECTKQVRLTIVGHSFGGLIVYNALDQSLIRDMADLHERIVDAGHPTTDPLLAREGDLIITINPAVEAARFVPLWLASRAAAPQSYHAPTFVSITSTDDNATRLAFPAARSFSTILNRYPAGDERERAAAVETLGQDQDYVDYDLNTLSKLDKDSGRAPITVDADCKRLRGVGDFSERYAVELGRLKKFEAALQKDHDANHVLHDSPRQFCINDTHNQKGNTDVAMALRPRKGVNLNSPVWNVSTASPVVLNHSDLLNPILIDFLRQLYEEGTSPALNELSDAAEGTEQMPAPLLPR